MTPGLHSGLAAASGFPSRLKPCLLAPPLSLRRRPIVSIVFLGQLVDPSSNTFHIIIILIIIIIIILSLLILEGAVLLVATRAEGRKDLVLCSQQLFVDSVQVPAVNLHSLSLSLPLSLTHSPSPCSSSALTRPPPVWTRRRTSCCSRPSGRRSGTRRCSPSLTGR